MFTQCPECQSVHSVKPRQLRKNRGIFHCKICGGQFDALQSLSETAPKKKYQFASQQDSRMLLDNAQGTASSAYWTAGFCAGLVLLAGQFLYFEQRNLAQNTAARPWLEKLCTALPCRLPVYRNVGELDILHSTLQLRADQNYRLQAALVNHSGFAQAYPQLKLSLMNFNGDSFAARVFSPQEYLPQEPQALIAAGAVVEIGLDIAAPAVPVGGYSIEFL